MSVGRVLVLVSGADQIPLKEGGVHPTGHFLGELTEPVKSMHDAGYELVFASPGAKMPSIDPNSYNLIYWGNSKKRLEQAQSFYRQLLRGSLGECSSFGALMQDESRLDGFDALFVPGGHAPMVDLLHTDFLKSSELNPLTGRLLSYFHRHQKPTGLICHASAILAAAVGPDGKCIYEGYNATCVSRASERLLEEWWSPFRQVHGHIKEYPNEVLSAAGVKVKNTMPGRSLVVEDRELMTGQDPYSAEEMGEKFVQKLNAYMSKKK